MLFVVFVVDRLGRDGTDVGIIRGTMAIGAVLGAALIARLADPRRSAAADRRRLHRDGAGVAWCSGTRPLVTDALWVYILLFALSGIPGSALSVGIVTTVQTHSPPAVLGRVVGVMRSVESIGQAGASILAGVLVDTVSLTALLDAQAIVYIVCGVLTWQLSRAGAIDLDVHPPPPTSAEHRQLENPASRRTLSRVCIRA